MSKGRIIPRAMTQSPHSNIQTFLAYRFYVIALPLGYRPWVEQHLLTKRDPPRYRVPDVCLTFGKPDERIFTAPPFLCVEILSPEDAAVDLRIKVNEYLRFGVLYVWVIDPESLTGEVYTNEGIVRVDDGVFRAGQFEVDIREA